MLILQSGGPTAVGNACLAAAVEAAAAASDRLLGARRGMAGLLRQDIVELTSVEDWPAISRSPGAILGSSRYRPTDEEIGRIVGILRRADIHRTLLIGGNGTMNAAASLSVAAKEAGYELAVAGVPDTIDNDVPETEICLGYASCARYAAQTVLDVAADVRALPTPVSVVEVMGRNTGWVAAATILCRVDGDDAPHAIYLPETATTRGEFLRTVKDAFDRFGWVVVVVAEGAHDADGLSLAAPKPEPGVAGYGGAMIGDVGAALAMLVTDELGLRARSEKPGLAARAAPHLIADADRAAAVSAGRFAVARLFQGHGGFMVSLNVDGEAVAPAAVPLTAVAGKPEHALPAELLAPGGSDAQRMEPNAAFRRWIEPLIGPLRRYPRLL